MGSCTIRRDEYELDEDVGGKDDREWEVGQYDATSTMSMRIPAAWTIASKTR